MKLSFAIPTVILVLLLGAAFGPAQGSKKIPQGPDVTIFWTGDGEGEITSCGCPTLDYGGTTRKAAFFDTLRTSDWDFLLMDSGGIVPYDALDLQSRLKVETLAKTMKIMDYDAIALGDFDLLQGSEFVDSLVHWLDQPVVATNYSLGEGKSVREVRLTTRGKSVGVVAMLDPELVAEEHDYLQVIDWQEVTPQIDSLRAEVDILVGLVSVAGMDRLRASAEIFPQFDLVIGSHRGEMGDINELVGSVRVVGAPPKGRFLGRLDIAFDGEAITKTTGNYLPVIEQWGRRRNIDSLVSSYYSRLKTLVNSEAFLAEQTGDLKEPQVAYVGNNACISCHQPQHEQWASTGHASAKQTLEKDGKDHVPECQTCHSTGAGFRTGFVTPALTPDRWQVGCESCHGPGAGHLEDNHAPYGYIVEEACIECHTPHDSPDFDYETYLPKVTH